MIRQIVIISSLLAWAVGGAVLAADAPKTLAQVLAAGERAEAAKDAKELMSAAAALDAAGAHPEADTPNLARQWRAEALAWGAKDDAPWRGRTLGPAYRRGRVGGHSTFTTRQSFNAGQSAEISVATLSGGPLDLSVRNDDGDQTCRVSVSEREGGCRWIPVWTGVFTLTLDNTGDDASVFYIVTN